MSVRLIDLRADIPTVDTGYIAPTTASYAGARFVSISDVLYMIPMPKKKWWEKIESRHQKMFAFSLLLGVIGLTDLVLAFFGRSYLHWYNDVLLLLGSFGLTTEVIIMLVDAR